MSKDFNFLVKELQEKPRLISEFLSDESNFLSKYNLTNVEQQALLSRDVNALNTLGLSTGHAVGALSGAHSQHCRKIPSD